MKKYIIIILSLVFGTSILSNAITYKKTNPKNEIYNDDYPQSIVETVENKVENATENEIAEEIVLENENIAEIEETEKNNKLEIKSIISEEKQVEQSKTSISKTESKPTEKVIIQENNINNNNSTIQAKEETKQVENVKSNNKTEEKKNSEQVVTKEEFKENSNMINTIKNVINNNQSEDMKNYGYKIVVDSSIVDITSQFTYTEQRVIDKIAWKFGTIRIYARDYYCNGQYVWTECFII